MEQGNSRNKATPCATYSIPLSDLAQGSFQWVAVIINSVVVKSVKGTHVPVCIILTGIEYDIRHCTVKGAVIKKPKREVCTLYSGKPMSDLCTQNFSITISVRHFSLV